MGGSCVFELSGGNVEVVGGNFVCRSTRKEGSDGIGGLGCCSLGRRERLFCPNINGRATGVIVVEGVTSSA